MDAHAWSDVIGFGVLLATVLWKGGRIELKLDLLWRDYIKRKDLNGEAMGD